MAAVARLLLLELQPGADSSDIVTTTTTPTPLPLHTHTHGHPERQDQDPDLTGRETETPGDTELVSGEAQALENVKLQPSDMFSHLIFSRGL